MRNYKLKTSERTENFSKEIEVIKKNQMEIKELKNYRNNTTNWMSLVVEWDNREQNQWRMEWRKASLNCSCIFMRKSSLMDQ